MFIQILASTAESAYKSIVGDVVVRPDMLDYYLEKTKKSYRNSVTLSFIYTIVYKYYFP